MLAALAARKVTITVTFQGDLEQADSGKNAVEKSKKQSAAKDAVVRLLNNAQKSLGLSDSIHVVFLNDYHASRSEPTSHVTFTFEEHACEGTCTGHAFGKGLGEIFRHDGKSLYRKEK
ncbi:hypothetical protein GYMLUDRAFT_262104 [Collybiopsis luxurians FD-317 M1]|uniref:Uncharacterized protein n=1 Tax=Collybiopsis luxurians FD-317 M1 TaxID=944289 RepID=A0A0D0CU46_9AGAR|nr:hypothetical protein GYMLUDRAFT_262104 [Collybiopsis luxurians FD-317 M1]